MRVLLVGINYAPDLIGVAKYNSELCENLAAEGHDVRVITAPPYYPAWKILPSFSNSYFRSRHIDGVRVTRTPIYVPGRPSGVKRLVHHGSFALSSAIPVLVDALSWRPDVMIAVTPSLMSAAFVSFVARRVGAKSWLAQMDAEDGSSHPQIVRSRFNYLSGDGGPPDPQGGRLSIKRSR